ncbi:interferon-inducible double-stranded RNA-dependent protein kinase activator A homolog isoform X2 [Thrips palmi]|uniref:Interferon-inducible double-stranded RNA-dependent protein kinase activator A homolog isoform X2 n=1 Tax=Thrips palmi TaxID=161013 RepID=A0A6P8Z672_THRPL|nr:interferon-inducible double-stranded RNA-dependent protein kinase activator A homolog isoform X2 [Thrips palmi]
MSYPSLETVERIRRAIDEEEMKELPSKTPVSVLQELLSRRGTTPTYELVQIEGAIHEPTFRYRVTVADVVALGTGRSKKEAKHAAAKAVLDKLIGGQNEGMVNNTTANIPDVQIVSPYDDKIPGNPIGTLQEQCMSRRWPPPIYEMESEEGLPHERQFTIACIILNHKEIGCGKSKKLAKRQAAHKMLDKLEDSSMEHNNARMGYNEDEDEISQRVSNVASRFAGLKDNKFSTMTAMLNVKVSQFHKNIKCSTGPKLDELKNQPLNQPDFNYVKFLQEIAAEQEIEVSYIDIEEKSMTGKMQCLIQLSTLPVAVCYGAGHTSKEAQSAAAQNTLEYLKILTKL